LLLGGQQKTLGADTEKQNSIAAAARWLTGRAPGARALPIATIALLFIWVGVDQLHFWWSSEANALPALQHAAALNPNDSSVQVRLARAEQLAGQRDAAPAAIQRAAAVNPANLALQQSCLSALSEDRWFGWSVFETVASASKKNVPSCIAICVKAYYAIVIVYALLSIF
jgi:hypothetical protein